MLERRERIGDVLERAEHRLLVLVDGGLVARLRRAALREQRAAVEDRLAERRADAPDRARAGQHRRPAEAAFAHRRRQRQLREQLRGRHAHFGRGGLQRRVGGADVGPALQQVGRHHDGHLLGQMEIVEREVGGRLVGRAADQHRERMACRIALLAQRGQARREGLRALPRVQRIAARRGAERMAALGVVRLRVGERDEPLGRVDLRVEHRRRDRRGDDVRGECAARGLELERADVDAFGERAVREARGAEQVDRVVRLNLPDERVVQQRRLAERGDRHAERALARRLAARVDRREHRAADLRAQLFARRGEAVLGRAERRAVAQPFVDHRVQCVGAELPPPVGHRLRADFELLRDALRGDGLRGLRRRAVVRGRRHRGRLAARREPRAAGQRRDARGRERARGFRHQVHRQLHDQAPDGVAGGVLPPDGPTDGPPGGSRSSFFTRNHAAYSAGR
ncbi:hypothetical protein BST28156_03212 [Burkholderia stagnalis]|nr:hypothetical protein BST28156_03212 [Burkholderia stagnalis]